MAIPIEVPFVKEQLEYDYQTKTLIEIAKKFNVSKKYVLNWMKIYGIPRRKGIPPTKEIENLSLQGYTASEIAQKLGKSPSYISAIGRRYHIFILDKYHPGFITHHGYIYLHVPDHPFRDKRGYIPLHRLVMEKHLKRYLTPYEISHHINGNKKDNRIANLSLTDKSNHQRDHHLHPRWKTPYRTSKKPRTLGDFSQSDTISDR